MLQKVDNSQHWKQTPTCLSDFLHGQLVIAGSFRFWLGGFTRQFNGKSSGTWCDDVLVLEEDFEYDNGRHEQRTWRLKFESDGSLTSKCSDVIGEGTGSYNGFCYTHSYLFRLPIGRSGFVVRIKEIYEPLDSARILCNAKLSRWGIPIGVIRMQFERY